MVFSGVLAHRVCVTVKLGAPRVLAPDTTGAKGSRKAAGESDDSFSADRRRAAIQAGRAHPPLAILPLSVIIVSVILAVLSDEGRAMKDER